MINEQLNCYIKLLHVHFIGNTELLLFINMNINGSIFGCVARNVWHKVTEIMHFLKALFENNLHAADF